MMVGHSGADVGRTAQPDSLLNRDLLKKFGARFWICCGLLLSIFSARAEAPAPPREFWDYLAEFGGDNGELFDPVDLSVAVKVRDDHGDAGNASDAKSAAEAALTGRRDTDAAQAAGDKHP